MNALILFSHGSLLCGAGEALDAHAGRLRRTGEWDMVAVGYMNYSEPTFAQSVAECAGAGATRALVLPFFLVPGYFVTKSLPEHLEAAKAAHPHVEFTVAEAMGTSQPKAKGIPDRLVQARWQGHPLAELVARPDGLNAYLPGRRLVVHEELAEPEPLQAAPARTPGREAVIAHSRARYAKSREEVEREIAERMGWGPPAFAGDDPAVAEGKRRAFKAMTDVGMPRDQALDLLSRFDLGGIERQIAWLPSRGAKNPARYLAAAIEGGYDMPLSLRRQAGQIEEGSRTERESRAEEGGAEGDPDTRLPETRLPETRLPTL